MTNQDYLWFVVTPDEIGNVKMRNLTRGDVESTLGHYIINPLNRSILKSVPNMIRNVEENARELAIPREQDVWNDDKESLFKGMVEDSYDSLMATDMQTLIQKYISDKPTEEGGWKSIHDLGEIGSSLKLEDLLNKNEARKFVGFQYAIGETDYSSKQKKLSNYDYVLNNKELFGLSPRDDSILSYINVKFNKPKEAEEFGKIIVNFTLDHSNGTVSRKIFEDAGFTKWGLKTDPGSYGGSIREGNYSLGWNHNPSPITAAKLEGSKAFDPDAISYGEGKTKEKARKEYGEIEIGRERTRIEEQIRLVNNRAKEYATITDDEANKLIESFKNKIEGLKLSPTRQVLGFKSTRDTLQSYVEDFTITITKADSEELKSIFNKAYDPTTSGELMMETRQTYDEEGIRDLFEKWIKDGTLYDYLKTKVEISPWRLMKYKIKFTLERDRLGGTKLELPSHGTVEAVKEVSKEKLGKPAKMESRKQSKYIHLPVSRTRGAASRIEDTKEKEGINEARQYLLDKVLVRVKKLKSAALAIDLNL